VTLRVGIYARGTKNYSDGSPTPTGADATLNHDPNGNWQNAISYCHDLSEAGGVVTCPIPTLDVGLGTAHSDWRLPTQKELMHLHNADISGLNQTANLTSRYGSTHSQFWSASTISYSTDSAWTVHLSKGSLVAEVKSLTSQSRVICVR
jgi:hypothetical protein